MKLTYLSLATFIIAFLLSACCGSDLTNASQLEGHTWVLTTYNDNQPIAGHQPTLQPEDGQVSGTTGCNHYGGSYQIEGDSIRFEALFNTEMACLAPEGLMEQEQIYLGLLRAANHFELVEGRLTLFIDQQPALIFEFEEDGSN